MSPERSLPDIEGGESAFDPATLDFYAQEAPVYTASGKDGSFGHLEPFLALLAPGASILELGCGGGYDAAFMLARGFEVDATDGVAAMAVKAEAYIGRPVRVMRFHELHAVERYDAVVAAASPLHVPRAGLSEILARIYRALRPGGWHIASFKGGGIEGRDRFGRYFNYLNATEAEAAYRAAAPWASLEIDEGTGGGYDGVQGPWLKVLARKQ
jgi:SAM-dependent methyltransferase